MSSVKGKQLGRKIKTISEMHSGEGGWEVFMFKCASIKHSTLKTSREKNLAFNDS